MRYKAFGEKNPNQKKLVNSNQLNPGDRNRTSKQWQEQYKNSKVLGEMSLKELSIYAKGLSEEIVEVPKNRTEKEIAPKIKVSVNLTEEQNEQKSVDEGHSPWKLDPVFVAQVFASLLLSPEGIIGDYPIAYNNIRIIKDNGVEAIAEIKDKASIARYVYMKRLVRQDYSGIWTVVGYDSVDK